MELETIFEEVGTVYVFIFAFPLCTLSYQGDLCSCTNSLTLYYYDSLRAAVVSSCVLSHPSIFFSMTTGVTCDFGEVPNPARALD